MLFKFSKKKILLSTKYNNISFHLDESNNTTVSHVIELAWPSVSFSLPPYKLRPKKKEKEKKNSTQSSLVIPALT